MLETKDHEQASALDTMNKQQAIIVNVMLIVLMMLSADQVINLHSAVNKEYPSDYLNSIGLINGSFFIYLLFFMTVFNVNDPKKTIESIKKKISKNPPL